MSNHHSHAPTDPTQPDERYSQATWDDRYAASDRVWSGNPNAQLVTEVTGLAPGDALDVGAGEGGDAVWLAGQGWQVTALDVSPVALAKVRANADASGVGDRVAPRQHDLMSGEPLPGTYDLVTAHFWHPPVARRGEIASVLGAAVRPGGTLLVVGHHPGDVEGRDDPHGHAELAYTPEQVAALLPESDWDLVVVESRTRPTTRSEGPAVLTDSVVRAVRRR